MRLQCHEATAEGIRGKHGFFIRELPFITKADINIVEEIINERYPEFGYGINHVSEMFVRVLTGSVYFYSHNRDSEFFTKGETLLVPKDLPYYWIPVLPAVLLITSSPKWTKEQYEIVTF